MITLDKISAVKKKKRKRVGRGDASGFGKTCGRGTKGQKARSKIRPGFEGGQMPLTQRIPKRKGFSNIFQKKFSVLNVLDLEKNFKTGEKIDYAVLLKMGLVKKNRPVKVLGDGELKRALMVEVQAFSSQAKKKIESAKGKAVVVQMTQERKAKDQKIPEKKIGLKLKQKKPSQKTSQNKIVKKVTKESKVSEKPKGKLK
ncbi:50S ribosomal protein L15 [Patescibacteria group bacterium]|nr:MAG: 50S ribosomal protein L15 [Patescibacteria group bacterium]